MEEEYLKEWVLQLKHTRWVVWKYERDHPQTEVSQESVHLGVVDLSLDFNLNDHRSDQYPEPVEIERKTCWGWRFFHPPTMHDAGGWKLANSQQEAVTDARVHVRTTWSLRNSQRPAFLRACESPVIVDG